MSKLSLAGYCSIRLGLVLSKLWHFRAKLISSFHVSRLVLGFGNSVRMFRILGKILHPSKDTWVENIEMLSKLLNTFTRAIQRNMVNSPHPHLNDRKLPQNQESTYFVCS